MKNAKKLIGIIALVAVMATFAGCAMFATIDGTPTKTGFFWTGTTKDGPAGEEIASYMRFYGISIGYEDFIDKVKGKSYNLILKNYYIFEKVIAVAK